MSNSVDFAGKVALITGSGRGIGRAIALHFAKHGADVVINFFRNRSTAEETAKKVHELGRRALLVKANIGNLAELDGLFAKTEAEFGRLDFFIHNAASGYNRPVMEQKPRGWDWTMGINARAFLFGARRAAQMMQGHGGAIVAISSLGAHWVLPEYVTVGASKAALEALVRYLAVELAEFDIVVNGVAPGVVLTDALRHFSQLKDESLISRIASSTPAGRLVSPEDVAATVAFLCSPEAFMIRGQIITVDGGYTLTLRV